MAIYDVETANPPSAFSAFEDKAIRRGFIRKVFSLVTLQLIVAVGECRWMLLSLMENRAKSQEVEQNATPFSNIPGVALPGFALLVSSSSNV